MVGCGKCVTSPAAFVLLFIGLASLPVGHQQQLPQPAAESGRIDVAVYYESLCPDSINFITQELQPTWSTMSQYMNIRLVPFGKSASYKSPDGSVAFQCQHGPRECSGNKMQACALHYLQTADQQVQFVSCVMRQSDPSQAGPQCAAHFGLDYQLVQQCIGSSLGTNLQLLDEQETNRIQAPIRFVPTIAYHGSFDQNLQDESLQNFKGVLCGLLSPPPQECASK